MFRPNFLAGGTLAIAIGLQLLLIFNFAFKIDDDEAYAFRARHDIQLLKTGNRFFSFSDLFNTYLSFYNEGNKDFVMKYVVPNGNSMISFDTLSETGYDFFIVDRRADMTQNRRPILKNTFYSVYAQNGSDTLTIRK